ncbi:MAG TPA: class I SAM-dependent methyltransferase [Hyphomicrobiaceae bacterium]|nr:class I SAM-dependent methyltransferase [Hyphomicrobiaceae bacterium]
MSSFTPHWLALREPVDRRSRNADLARHLADRFRDARSVSVVDLGCGTGSNLRATAPLLTADQCWTLIDADATLLDAAGSALWHWADVARQSGDTLMLEKEERKLVVILRQADLAGDLGHILQANVDLVTASALFDLASTAFIERIARMTSARRAAFYTVLTYDGRQTWTPAHAGDADLLEAFHAHQRTDKGLGIAAGPAAPAALAAAFRSVGYEVKDGDSPWVLGPADERLIADLAAGFAAAVRETGRLDPTAIDDWLSIQRTAAEVGHIDTLALPPE